MDRLRLYSSVRELIPQSVLDNNFRVEKYNNKQHLSKDGVTCIIKDWRGTSITTNPTRFLKGNNLVQISKEELKQFTGEFEEYLQVNSSALKVTGLDYNKDFRMQYPPDRYYDCFSDKAPYHFTFTHHPVYKEGLSYYNNCKALDIYDKKRKHLKDKLEVPEHLQDANLLRIELSINNRLSRNTRLQNIKHMEDLTKDENYNGIVTEWHELFNRIQKTHESVYQIRGEQFRKPQRMLPEQFAIISLISQLTMDGYFRMIDLDVKMGTICSKKAGKAKKDKAKMLWQMFLSDTGNGFDLLNELQSKVDTAAQDSYC